MIGLDLRGADPTVGVATSYARLATAVAVWSLSPLLIYEARGLAKPPILALYAVAIGSLLALLIVSRSATFSPRALGRAARQGGWAAEAGLIGMAAFVAYPLLYFSAIQNAPPVAVNLVNYLWPVVAVIVVSIARPASRSLEVGLAAGFGFAGAGLAIAAGAGADVIPSDTELYPFLLAGLGAITYGGASGLVRLLHPRDRELEGAQVMVLALLFAGVVASVLLVALAIANSGLVTLDLSDHRPWTLLVYAALYPVAHLSWMAAVRDRRVPAFSSAFLVPVASTAILTLVLTGQASTEILSALVLVMCGITFANAPERGVPVGYAVGLALLASIQISQVLAGRIGGEVNTQTFSIAELIAAIIAVFAGFVLSNAIQRNAALQRACNRFYAHAAFLARECSTERVTAHLDVLDCTVIHGATAARPVPPGALDNAEFAPQWAEVEVARGNRVSGYEWLVLFVGGGSLVIALHAYAVNSTAAFTVILRALGVALIVGILFAVRDYDRHRPERLCELLSSIRVRYGFPIEVGSPLANGVESWASAAPRSLRFSLATLVLVAVGAIVLNG